MVAVNGTIHTYAGDATLGLSGDGSAPLDASLNSPTGVALDGAGDIFIADSKNNVVREVVESTGVIQTAAGRTSGSGGNGTGATSAPLNDPTDVFIDSAGNLFIADTGNNLIREVVAATGNIQTVATVALSAPSGVFVDGAGDIFIADTGNNVIREIPAGVHGPNANGRRERHGRIRGRWRSRNLSRAACPRRCGRGWSGRYFYRGYGEQRDSRSGGFNRQHSDICGQRHGGL